MSWHVAKQYFNHHCLGKFLCQAQYPLLYSIAFLAQHFKVANAVITKLVVKLVKMVFTPRQQSIAYELWKRSDICSCCNPVKTQTNQMPPCLTVIHCCWYLPEDGGDSFGKMNTSTVTCRCLPYKTGQERKHKSVKTATRKSLDKARGETRVNLNQT